MQEEKVYKTMKAVSVWSLVLGILTNVFGTFFGACLIVSGARLLKDKSAAEALINVCKTMKTVGIWNLVIGILSVILCNLLGVVLIIHSKRLSKSKTGILF